MDGFWCTFTTLFHRHHGHDRSRQEQIDPQAAIRQKDRRDGIAATQCLLGEKRIALGFGVNEKAIVLQVGHPVFRDAKDAAWSNRVSGAP